MRAWDDATTWEPEDLREIDKIPVGMQVDDNGRPLSEWGTSYAQEAREDVAELRGRIPCALRFAGEESPRRPWSKRRPSLDHYDNLGAGRNSVRFWKITGEGT